MVRTGMWCAVLAAGLTFAGGCGKSSGTKIRVEGSDTMIELATAWAEEYMKLHPDINLEVSGHGSAFGITALTDGACEICNSSRTMDENEKALAKKKTGKDPVEHTVGFDALAVYVHKDNPVDTLTIQELAEIFGEQGKITDWSGVAGGSKGEITCYSRQSNSGTYKYFKEHVMGKKRNYREGTLYQNGSAQVVAMVGKTKGGIGYSGMAYYKPDLVKMVKVAAKSGQTAIAPSVAAAQDRTYPITRPLLVYTAGEPTGAVKTYVDWMMSKEGQDVLEKMGYVPLTKKP